MTLQNKLWIIILDINYDHSKYKGNQFLSSIIACMLPQFLSLGFGKWWLFIVLGAVMILIYKKPELYGRKGLKMAIISTQLANFIGGVAFYYLTDYRSEIVLVVGAFCLIFPIRRMLIINREINVERKQSQPA